MTDTAAPNVITGAFLNTEQVATFEKIFPVGSIYITTDSSINPAEIFGVGTWEIFGQGRTLVGLDTSQSEFSSIQQTGGEKTHTLTVSEMPSHSHNITCGSTENAAVVGSSSAVFRQEDIGDSWCPTGSIYDAKIQNTGGGQPHNNLQPYIIVIFWHRIS